jgi:coenzyme F420-reducing hydrogenase gamma subunit
METAIPILLSTAVQHALESTNPRAEPWQRARDTCAQVKASLVPRAAAHLPFASCASDCHDPAVECDGRPRIRAERGPLSQHPDARFESEGRSRQLSQSGRET